ncbi:phospholipid phosphatase-related protein type 4 isoform X2 [Denticeps clupeoides]|uniref:phospholipid phosphatase-related protein type 4 isoform X2 n=1 Tax=Denticeps clupeoides TaxID=299321 RepID=UPI0010A3C48B|nr:phospholipid phosphatase-related protein type 4-like isoform X2 [Denticeps clupeoides]
MSAKERLKGQMTKDSVTLLPCFYFVEIMIGEGILYCCLARRNIAIKTEASINAAGCNFNSYIRRAVRFIGVHVFGLCITALITDIIQLSTGYHTPYFLTVCKPNYTTLNTSCDDSIFIMEDICSGSDTSIITAGRKSFPSQHATLAAFAAVYVSMYFNATLTDSSKLLKPLLVFSFVICAIICGLTRIIQFKNHAIDVYCGFLIGGGIAAYLGVYAVSNFQPSQDTSRQPQAKPVPSLREPLCTLPNVSQEAARTQLRPPAPKSLTVIGDSAATGRLSRSESLLSRPKPIYREASSLNSLKRASADVECISPSSPLFGKDGSLVTFSNTLPRVHSTAGLEEVSAAAAAAVATSRRHASIHASMDSARSKQLLSQWKSRNENRKFSLHVLEPEVTGRISPHRNMELRCSSEPSAVGLDGELRGGGPPPALPAAFVKLPPGAIPLPNHINSGGSSGIAGGARVSIQSRPGSSQLVHIPEEVAQESPASPPATDDDGDVSDGGGATRSKWIKVAEKTRTNSQPRIMQVIAMSKQQGLLHHGSPKSEASTVSCTGSIRYKALMDQEPGAGIVRVEAHPENSSNGSRPVVKPPSTDGGGSWRWKPPEQRGSIRQTFELNDLNRESESCESLKDGYGSVNGKRSLPDMSSGEPVHPFHHPYYHHHHHQGITTIRVTPVQGDGAGSEAASETLSIASSRDSTLRRKANIILLPERGSSPDNSRNMFFKGPSPTPPPTLTFKE